MGSAVSNALREKNTRFEFRHIEPDNRPDWFLAISPHKKVPVLRVDDTVSLFESSAINEYLDETISPRLHPEDPVQRAINRAWTDYVPTFAEHVTGVAYADDEAAGKRCLDKIPVAFERLERALEKQGAGPLFNGAKYSLVDAAYAPFLQRYFFLDRIRPIGHIAKYPRLKVWADTLMKRPSTHSFPETEFEQLYRTNVKRRKKWLSCNGSTPFTPTAPRAMAPTDALRSSSQSLNISMRASSIRNTRNHFRGSYSTPYGGTAPRLASMSATAIRLMIVRDVVIDFVRSGRGVTALPYPWPRDGHKR